MFWENNIPKLSGLWEFDQYEIDVVFPGSSVDYTRLKEFEDCIELTGVVTHKISRPFKDRIELIVKDVRVSIKDSVYTKHRKTNTKNNMVLSLNEIDGIENCSCNLCGGVVNVMYLDRMLVTRSHGKIDEVYCHECADYVENAYAGI